MVIEEVDLLFSQSHGGQEIDLLLVSLLFPNRRETRHVHSMYNVLVKQRITCNNILVICVP